MVLTRSQYKKLGEILVTTENHKKVKTKRMTKTDKKETGDSSTSQKPSTYEAVGLLQKQMESMNSTLSMLTTFITKEGKKTKTKKESLFSKPQESDEEDTEDEEEDEEVDKTKTSHRGGSNFQNLKIDFKVELPMYDGSVDVEKLDDWIERLETYFTLYGFSSKEKIIFATLKLSSHALMWWKSYRKYCNDEKTVSWRKFKELLKKQLYPVGFVEERWQKWYNLRQKFNQLVQEYTTEFQNQAMVLDIPLEDYSIYMKYVAGLNEYIRKELKLFTIESIHEATVKAIAFEGKLKKSDNKNNANHCKASGHVEDKCWDKHPELPNLKLKLNMMTWNPITEEQDDPREHLFCVKLQVKTSLVDAIVDIGWIQKDSGLSVTQQCTFRFALHESYIGEIISDVVPIDVCQVIFGNPYLWDRYALYDMRNRKYTFTKDGAQFVIRVVQPPQGINLITTAQAKRLVNACGKFVLLMVRQCEELPSKVSLTSLSTKQDSDLKQLKIQFGDLFQDLTGLPPRRSIEPDITLVGESSLPNLGLYHTSLQESDEIKRQDGKPVEYHSELFTRAIKNYPLYDKELYALYQAVKHWRVYLLGKDVVVHSDHKPLEYLHAQTKLQQARHMKYKDFKDVYEKAQQGYKSEFEIRDDLLYKGSLLCIPEDGDRLQWIREAHTFRVAGHFGVEKTLSNLRRYVVWPKMQNDVSRYVRGCKLCFTSKPANRKKVHSSSGKSPFETCYGYLPPSPFNLAFTTNEVQGRKGETDKLRAQRFLEKISQIHATVEAQLKKSQEKYKAKHDKHRVPCNFSVGDLVWLKLSKERLKGEGKKLKPLRYGPFRILDQIGDNAFKLDLPPYLGMYLVINVEYLKLFEPPLLDDAEDDKVVLPMVDDLWFDREEPLKTDCILERKMTSTQRGDRIMFRIGRVGQLPSKARWFNKDQGALEFPNLLF
ncbi:hypothetical protein POM88_033419 [Heracleum sosnowskyi]|uniref:Uncharacterized protein n=1 Tax=Heracleum sosnowskyi TaxID=360622 RepID=A0AAD8I1H2_9APIA|nr:hypothetical protein POM88_033419 [Heracleum sosnowskyi]